MRIKFTSIFSLASLFLGLQTQVANAQCDTASIAGQLILCNGDSTVLTGPSPWQQKASAPIGRDLGVGFSIGTKAYVGLGYEGDNIANTGFWEYDPSTDTWTQKANFPGVARYGLAYFAIGTKGYVGLGEVGGGSFGSNALLDFWEYTPTSNTWLQKSNFPGGERILPVNFSIGAKGYVGAGAAYDSNTGSYVDANSAFYEYDPTNDTWTQKSNSPVQGAPGTSISIGSKGYVFNVISVGSGISSNNVYEYNPTNDTWIQKTSYPGLGDSYGAGFAIGSVGYFGFSNGADDFWKYNPATDSWSATYGNGNVQGRSGMQAFSIDSIGYIFGGYANSYSFNDLWRFLPFSSYTWSTGETAHSIVVDSAGTYTLNITYPYGCPASSESVTVVFNSLPTLNVSGTDSICWGNSTILTATGSGLSYIWSTGDSTAAVTVNPMNDTTYYVSVVDANNCSSMDSINVIVNSLPSVAITGSDSVCSGSSTLLTATGSGSFVWTTGDSTATTTIAPTNDTTYYVTITDANGCSSYDSITVYVSVCSGINELGANQNISLYPNPASNLVKVSANGALLETIKIYNLAGALVYEQVAGKSEEVLNINIPAGVYYMHLKTDAGTSIKKFVVQ